MSRAALFLYNGGGGNRMGHLIR